MDIVDKHARSTTKANRPVRQVWTNCQHSWGRSPTPAHVEIDRRGPAGFFLALGQSPVLNFHQPISESTFVGQLCQDIAKISDFCSICSFQADRWLDRTEEWCLHYTQFESAQFPDHVTTLTGIFQSSDFEKKGDGKSIESYNYAGGVETRLRTEGLWADLFHQIKPWNARWRVKLGSCLLWRRAVCGCAQILYRVPSPRNVISGHTMSNFFLPFSFSSPSFLC